MMGLCSERRLRGCEDDGSMLGNLCEGPNEAVSLSFNDQFVESRPSGVQKGADHGVVHGRAADPVGIWLARITEIDFIVFALREHHNQALSFV
uniref:Uncharacterized protein n=1 Tax=Paraburkholderia sprentiae WSM5005 TaxID=754502 RepID=A0A1I9YTH1_9BURK